jgi:hypothetical protein
MTTIQVIHNITFDYVSRNESKVGSLMFPDELWDCKDCVDIKKFRKNIKDKLPLLPLPKGARIQSILVYTNSSPHFKNIANKLIPYKYEVGSHKNADGAFVSKCGITSVLNPLGDAIVVYK